MREDKKTLNDDILEKYKVYLDLRGISIQLEKEEPIIQQENYEIY